MKTKPILILGCVIFASALWVACGTGGQVDPTLQAKIDSFAKTVTVRASGGGEAEAALQTAQVEATARSQTINATQSAQDSLFDQNARATDAAAVPILAELPLYGVDESKGHVGWIHPPVKLEIDEFRTGDFANDYANVSARDFVLAADITWDTQYGFSGCGFMLRSDGEEEAPNQYLVIASRNGTGHVYFTALAGGKPANYKSLYANGLDPAFEWQNGTTNRLAVVARGTILSIYTNYTLIGEIDTTEPPPTVPDLPPPPQKPTRPDKLPEDRKEELLAEYEEELKQYQDRLEEHKKQVMEIKDAHAAALRAYYTYDTVYDEGFLGMFAFAYSGYAVCQFDNAWLWHIDG